MKKSVFSIYKVIFTVISLNLFSCASNSIKPVETDADNEISKKVKSVSTIAQMIMDNNFEGAYYRMGGDFRAVNSYEKFYGEWETAASGNGDIEGFTIDTSEYDALNFFRTIKVYYNYSQKKIPVRYLFRDNGLIPSEFIIGGKDTLVMEKQLPLKDLCSEYFKFGCGISGYNEKSSALNVKEFMQIVKEEFSSCTSTNLMKPSYVLDQAISKKNYADGIDEPGMNFSSIDKTLSWCMKNQVALRGHTLVWHSQTPEWFFKEGYKSDGNYVSREIMIQRLDSFIRQYMTYVQTNYPDTVYCWDVVNEAVDPDKGDSSTDFMCRIENSTKDSGWYQTIGNDYPEVAFSIARKYADKNVKLFYNDYGTTGKKKRQCIYNLCKSLKEKGLIDGIGMQGYWDVKNPSLKEIEDTINLYSELGIEIQLTEWTIQAKDKTDEAFQEQAERYASVLKLLQKLDTQGGGKADITCVSFFGLQDGFSLNINDTNTSRLYDKDFNPKPVYFSIQDVFNLYY